MKSYIKSFFILSLMSLTLLSGCKKNEKIEKALYEKLHIAQQELSTIKNPLYDYNHHDIYKQLDDTLSRTQPLIEETAYDKARSNLETFYSDLDNAKSILEASIEKEAIIPSNNITIDIVQDVIELQPVTENIPVKIDTPNTVSYSVKKHDSLWSISQSFYGSGFDWTIIYKANSDYIKDPNLIFPNQIFSIPQPETPSP